MQINVERDEDDNWIASEQEFGVYGHGQTPVAAIQDWMKSRVEYRDIVAKSADTNPQSRALLQRLNQQK